MSIHFNSATAGVATRSVLVVDDMEANRAVVQRRLEKLNYAVSSAASGPAALTMLKQWQPDVLLLDYMMPHMNGIEVLRELRANSATRELPVIMVTARAESEAVVEALAAGADDYVAKPIDFDVLQARIETQLGKRTGALQLQRANAALDERITMRSMVLADLECELKGEIRRRLELEKKLAASATDAPQHTPVCTDIEMGGNAPAVAADELAALIEQIAERFDRVFEAVTAGRSVNLAQMAELRALLFRARSGPLK